MLEDEDFNDGWCVSACNGHGRMNSLEQSRTLTSTESQAKGIWYGQVFSHIVRNIYGPVTT